MLHQAHFDTKGGKPTFVAEAKAQSVLDGSRHSERCHTAIGGRILVYTPRYLGNVGYNKSLEQQGVAKCATMPASGESEQ